MTIIVAPENYVIYYCSIHMSKQTTLAVIWWYYSCPLYCASFNTDLRNEITILKETAEESNSNIFKNSQNNTKKGKESQVNSEIRTKVEVDETRGSKVKGRS